MKILNIVMVFLSLAFSRAEDEFYVTFINKPGAVTYAANGKAVKVRDLLSPQTRLHFEPFAKMTCLSPKKGTFQYSASGIPKLEKQGIIASLKDILDPGPTLGSFKTRALDFQGYEPSNYFKSASDMGYILIIKDQQIPIDMGNKAKDGDFFFLQFKDKDQTVTRKISYNGKEMDLPQALFLTADGKLSQEPYLLCIQRKLQTRSISEKLAEFRPKFAERVDIKAQIEVFEQYGPQKDKEAFNNLLLTHFYSNYGKIGIELLERLK
ncbi:hypothetical protein [Pedobacter aquatilis]|uniref:hypothetical protein n=1 Tax=Pedobacter aquatilis TaxID=351343 RepID=UPI0029317D5B|nr:hypothetical protein [Pedobacter aquatilis]